MFHDWFSRQLSRRLRTKRAKDRPRRDDRFRRLAFEQLEERVPLSIDVSWTGAFGLVPLAPSTAIGGVNNQFETMIVSSPMLPGNVVAASSTDQNSPLAMSA